MKLSRGLDLVPVQVVRDPRLQNIKYDDTIYNVCIFIHVCPLVTCPQSDNNLQS